MADLRSRRLPPPEGLLWRAERDRGGAWVVVNENGELPLSSPDASTRMRAVHRAASVMEVHAALEWAVDLLHRIREGPIQWTHETDARLTWATVCTTLHVPSYEEEVKDRMHRRARELAEVEEISNASRRWRQRGRRD